LVDYEDQRAGALTTLRRLHDDRERARKGAVLVAAQAETFVAPRHRERAAFLDVVDQRLLGRGREPRAWHVVEHDRIIAFELAVPGGAGSEDGWLQADPAHDRFEVLRIARRAGQDEHLALRADPNPSCERVILAVRVLSRIGGLERSGV